MLQKLRAAGYPQTAIAFIIGTSQVNISRQLKKAEAQAGD
jgi:transcriptional regulator